MPLQSKIPKLKRSSLYCCLLRHGISRLPEVMCDKPSRKKFDRCPIGYFHIDLNEVRAAEGELYLFVAIDHTSKFVVTQLVPQANVRAAADFLQPLVAAVPYRIHTVLTDNGIQFADLPKNRNGVTARLAYTSLRPRLPGPQHLAQAYKTEIPYGPMARSNA